jgi:PhnB protein
MQSILNPYLSFADNARQAMEFYKSVFGGELTFMPFAGGPMDRDPANADKIMHSRLATPNGMTLMASDTPASMGDVRENGTICLSGDDEQELAGYWRGLSEGAAVSAPLAKAPWGDHFGMLTDRFGVTWIVNISSARAA